MYGDNVLSATNKKVNHMWSYLLHFPDIKGEADANSVDAMCMLCSKQMQASILPNSLPLPIYMDKMAFESVE